MESKILAAFFFLILFSGIALSVSTGQPAKKGVFVGVFREGAPRNMNYINQYEKQVGKKPAMVMWYQDFAQEFPKEEAFNVVNYGATPHIVWEPWYWSDHNKIKLKDITSGKWDTYIRSWAKGVKEFGHPIFLRVAHEFNMEGYPWGIVNNDKDPELYIKAFRHVVDIFKDEGAKNVKWVWAPMNYSFPQESWNVWEKAYPGNDYVDWIGFDGYNWGNSQSWSQWQAFKYLFREQVRRASKLWPTKPIMVAEFAATEQGGDKAEWIKEIPAYLKTSMRDIDLIIWFDLKKEADWRINSSPRSLAAYQQIMADPLFLSSGPALAAFTKAAERETKKTVTALRAPGEVKIDGDLRDWNLTSPIIMSDLSYFKEGLQWSGPADISGKIYLMWDNKYLYLATQVMDEKPMINNKERQDIWNGDAIELVLSTDPGADPKRDSFGRGDYQLGFSPGDGKLNKPSIWSWQRRRSPQGSEIVSKKIPNGYVIEAKIPWEFFPSGFVPSSGSKLGFDIAIDDADKTGEREKQFIWNGDFYFYKDPSVWGILEFK